MDEVKLISIGTLFLFIFIDQFLYRSFHPFVYRKGILLKSVVLDDTFSKLNVLQFNGFVIKYILEEEIFFHNKFRFGFAPLLIAGRIVRENEVRLNIRIGAISAFLLSYISVLVFYAEGFRGSLLFSLLMLLAVGGGFYDFNRKILKIVNK